MPIVLVQFLRDDADLAPYYTAGGIGNESVPTKAGSSAAFVTHPRVRVEAVGLASGESLRGRLYVQRQHTIEV